MQQEKLCFFFKRRVLGAPTRMAARSKELAYEVSGTACNPWESSLKTAFLGGVSRLGAGSGYQWLCFPTWNAFIPAGHCRQSQRPHATPAASPDGVVVNGPAPASSAARCDASDVVPKKDVLQSFKLFRAPTTCRKLKQVSRKKKQNSCPPQLINHANQIFISLCCPIASHIGTFVCPSIDLEVPSLLSATI